MKVGHGETISGGTSRGEGCEVGKGNMSKKSAFMSRLLLG